MRFAIVISRFNQNITQRLLDGSIATFEKHKVNKNSLKIIWVSGAFEIPLIAMKLAKSKKFNAIICLGCVLQGETLHNRYISESVSLGITYVSLMTEVPITFGVLTPNTMKQALERSGKNSANKGTEAAEAAIEMATITAKMKDESKKRLQHGEATERLWQKRAKEYFFLAFAFCCYSLSFAATFF